MSPPPEVSTVLAWHAALNAGDVDRLVSLSSDDVEVGGPRGTGSGAQLLRDWVARASIRLWPERVFHRADTVVVQQLAVWTSAETAQVVASVFLVRDGQVVRVARHPDLAEALGASGLDTSDELPDL